MAVLMTSDNKGVSAVLVHDSNNSAFSLALRLMYYKRKCVEVGI